MIKLGMIREADCICHIWHDNKLKDRVEYRLTLEEWRALNGLAERKQDET